MNTDFISTRLVGTDRVPSETAEWVMMLRIIGHEIYYYGAADQMMCLATASGDDLIALCPKGMER